MAGGIYSSAQIKRAVIDESTAAENQIVAGVANKILRVLEFDLVTNAANVVTWRSNSTDITGPMPLGTNGRVGAEFAEEGHFETAAGEALNLNAGTATAHGGWVVYVEV